jgi:hypothetical protein
LTRVFAPDVFIGDLISVGQSISLIKGDGQFSRPKHQWGCWRISEPRAFSRWIRKAWGSGDCGECVPTRHASRSR